MKNTVKSIHRIIDANFNRSREGLRVCEDVSRFIFDSPPITNALKNVRHRISGVLKAFPARTREVFLESRDVAGDVGKSFGLASEIKRGDPCDIFAANIERVKESLRVLEEFCKLLDPIAAEKISKIRFKVYDIEKKAIKKFKALRNTG